MNPNQVLVEALAVQAPTNYLAFRVDSGNGGHPVTNIGFEQQHARVTGYQASYWLESFSPPGAEALYTQLQYTQSMWMEMPIRTGLGTKTILFPHVTATTLTKVS